MKNVLLMLCTLITVGFCSAQSYSIRGAEDHVKFYYVDFSADMNNALDIDKTSEPKGLDFDAEVGLRIGDYSPYVYFGHYDLIGYSNYGTGLDYVFGFQYHPEFEIAAGANVGIVYRERLLDNDLYLGYAVRIKPSIQLNDYVGLNLRGQYQHRNDRSIPGIFEVAAGLTIRFL